MHSIKWIKIWFCIIVILIPLLGLFNYVIDPYGFNKKFDLKGINTVKEDNTRFTIKYKMPRLRKGGWDTLMLGTSRIGLMDTDVVNDYLDCKTFTISQPGSAMSIQFDSFLYAIEFNHVKNIIYGIDFMSFNKNLRLNDDYAQLKSKVKSFDEFYPYDIYFNLKTFKRSIATVMNNLSDNPKLRPFYSENGMRNFPNYKQLLLNGKFNTQIRIDRHIKKYFKQDGIYKNYEYSNEYMLMFEKIVDYCNKNGVNLYVYIPPVYYEHFYAFKDAGLKSEFERFKRELVKIVDFIDFTGVNSITVNKENYWDSSHLKKKHTNKIMAKLIQDVSIVDHKDFGVMVTKDNIEEHLERQNSEYRESNLKKILKTSY